MSHLFKKSEVDSVAQNKDILPFLRDNAWFQEAAAERILSELTELRETMDRFDKKRVEMIQELTSLLALQPRILMQPNSGEREKRLANLKEDAFQLKQCLSDAFNSFVRNSYRRYLPSENACGVEDILIQEMRSNLVRRFESILKPDVKKCLDLIDAFIKRCQAAEE